MSLKPLYIKDIAVKVRLPPSPFLDYDILRLNKIEIAKSIDTTAFAVVFYFLGIRYKTTVKETFLHFFCILFCALYI